MTAPLPRSFYNRDTVIVAHDLVGMILVRVHNNTILSGIITETEAYRSHDDPASHTYRGSTQRTAPMFGPNGHAYVYFIYGNHFCLNVVAKSHEFPSGAVLIRALQPLDGIDQMIINRSGIQGKNIANGPGKLTQALGITLHHNNHDMTHEGALYITQPPSAIDPTTILATPRIGISKGQDLLWRFVVKL